MTSPFRSPRVPKCQWEKREDGWYTHAELGGICLEVDGKWWHYARACPGGLTVTGKPYRTLKAAKRAAKRAAERSPLPAFKEKP